jgi:hypothetical protein
MHSGTIKPEESKYYQLVFGVLLGAGNTTDDKVIAGIDLCLPQGWKVHFDSAKVAKELAATSTDAAKKATEAAKKANEEVTANASKDVKDAAAKFLAQTNAFNGFAVQIKNTAELIVKVADYEKSKITPEEEADGKDATKDKDGLKAEGDKKVDKSVFDKVLDVVETVVNFVCKFKDNVKKLFTEKYTKKYYRRNRHRLFLSKSSKFLMSTENFWDDVTGFFKDIGEKIKETWNKVVDVAQWVFDKIKENVQKAIDWVKGIIESSFVKKIVGIVNCVTANMGIVNQLISTIKGITARVASLTGPVGIISTFIDLVCNLHKFREAFTYQALSKEEKVPLVSWRLYGIFIGKIFYAIGS